MAPVAVTKKPCFGLRCVRNELNKARDLRLSHAYEQAYRLVGQSALTAPALAPWLWMHAPALWQDLASHRCTLTRRSGQDADFVRQLWRNATFMRQFQRMAKPLPDDPQTLVHMLNDERAALLAENRALHWVIRNSAKQAVGLLSLMDINLQHRRGELLVGVLPGQWAIGPAAACMAAQFFFQVLKFHKLVALVHEDNGLSVNTAISLGFRHEGRLQDHFCDPATGQFSALLSLGLLQNELLRSKDARLRHRLLGRSGPSG